MSPSAEMDPRLEAEAASPAEPGPQEPTSPAAEPAIAPRAVPWFLLVAAVAFLAPLRAGVGPIRDIDTYWHLLVGQDILAGIPVTEAGRGWSFAPVADTWVSGQWLVETGFAAAVDHLGLRGLVVYRVLVLAASLVVLAMVTLRHRALRAGVLGFTIGALALTITLQERSQQVSFLLAPLVGWWALRLWREGRLPRWYVVLPLVVVWANAHGGWVILPLTLAVACLARLVDHGWRDRAWRTGLLLAIGAVAAAAVSPSGLDNVLAVRRFSASAGMIVEWQAVALTDWTTLPLALTFLAVILTWARARIRPTWGEIVLVGSLLAFGTIAWRNVAPAVLLLSPIVVTLLSRLLGEQDPVPEPRTWRPWSRASIAAGAIGTALGLLLALTQPAVPDSVPSSLLARLRDATAPQRVLDTYNISGPLLWFGGRPPHVLVAIDGRADRYGADYIERYQGGLLNARPGWQSLYDELRPTAALLGKDEALVGALVAEKGWVEVARDGGYVLLRAPDAPGWS
ncbi:MAG: hypothetical protein U0R76_11305 [Candidatus Nanopelagicales bacterium]